MILPQLRDADIASPRITNDAIEPPTSDHGEPPPADRPIAIAAREPMSGATMGWLIGLLVWTALLSFYHLSGGAGFEPTDAWAAQSAREMADTGDWIVPHFAGEPFLQKSPGPYYAIILASWVRGTAVDVAASRVPNAVAAVLLVALIFWITRRIAGDRAAVFGGFATASSIFVLFWSHRSNAELALACCTTAALVCFWIGTDAGPGRKRVLLWMVAYFAAGLGMLYKLPMPVACVGVPAFFYLLLRKRWRLLASPWHLLGLVLFLLPWLPWVIALCMQEPVALQKWRVEFVDRFTGELPNVEANKVWFFYLLYLLPPILYCLPYSLSLPGAIVRGFRRDETTNRDGMLFMVIWFFSLLAFFTASTGKELRYFLPALPPLFVLLGVELSDFFDPQRKRNPAVVRLGAVTVWIAMPLASVGGLYLLYDKWYLKYEYFPWGEIWPPYVVTMAILTLGTSLTAWLFWRNRTNAAFAALAGTMWVLWLWMWPMLMPLLVSQAPVRDFAEQLKDKLPAADRQYLRNAGFHDPRVIWLTDIHYPRVCDPLQLLEQQGGRRDLATEMRIVGEKMVSLLSEPEPILIVATRADYITFLIEAHKELAKLGREMPVTHLWLQSRCGPKYQHLVLFGNQPAPWGEVALEPPSGRLEEAFGNSE